MKNQRVIPIVSALNGLAIQGQRIHPKRIDGWFTRWRWFFTFLTQLVFYGLPWLLIDNRQAVLFDIEARRYYLFGLVLYPQDLIYLTGLLILCALGLFLFTTVAGRQWCGYTCPQTVYSQIFHWIESRVEGDRSARIRLDRDSWTSKKLRRRVTKHLLWLTLAFWTGFTFVGYFVPIRTLAADMWTLNLSIAGFFWVGLYTTMTYLNAGLLKERVCQHMCPYARFQSAMFDRDSLIVTYDPQRGEPRGPLTKDQRQGSDALATTLGAPLGDCIDCGLCVQVCPTGIDIRKGLQYECISCAACIDACNQVMTKISRPPGLIRYWTENGQQARWSFAQTLRRVLRPRVLIYAALLLSFAVTLGINIASRSTFKVDIVRDRNHLARVLPSGVIENTYRIHVMNVLEQDQRFQLTVEGLPGLKITSLPEFEVGAVESKWVPVRIQAPLGSMVGQYPVYINVKRIAVLGSAESAGDTLIEKTVFYVPETRSPNNPPPVQSTINQETR